jgi:hypothetical protein
VVSVAEHYQIEIDFHLGGPYERDIDLLEDIGIELDEIAGEAGPSAAIHGNRYSVTLALPAATNVRLAGYMGVQIVVDAVNRALAKRGDELDSAAFDQLIERMLVQHADAPQLALA